MIRPIAIYLPQFHPTPENDKWWGKGFTEWTNVTKAKPLFRDHYQPRLPSDLGFYDLRAIETIEEQAALAREYAIHGFSFYHYWFSGKRLLHDPLDLLLETKRPDFPFLLFWANESWSRRWLGEERDVLIRQEYSREDDLHHAEWLCGRVFPDKRYIRVDGKPVFVIYRPNDFPDIGETLKIFRETAVKKGFPGLYLIGNNSHTLKKPEVFDTVLNFEPQLGLLQQAFHDKWSWRRLLHNVSRFGLYSGTLKLYSYAETKNLMKKRRLPEKFVPCPFVGWDNTARRGEKGIILVGQDTQPFEDSLRWAKEIAMKLPGEEQFVFINAWNEWAEGNHLEPCRRYGRAFLETVKKVFAGE
ncbi:MAG TPA: glycoside hydrolase family 99-like domain-containing protein [Bacteroidia bacterium]|nr:glycoside hydrolase family 99-like domain-containing protein [Bacteroidia bacterium]